MSIASQITALTTDRNNIRTALVNKGVSTASSHGFDDFASDIDSISTGSGQSITNPIYGGTAFMTVSAYTHTYSVTYPSIDKGVYRAYMLLLNRDVAPRSYNMSSTLGYGFGSTIYGTEGVISGGGQQSATPPDIKNGNGSTCRKFSSIKTNGSDGCTLTLSRISYSGTSAGFSLAKTADGYPGAGVQFCWPIIIVFEMADGNMLYDFVNLGGNNGCFAADTLISLADGTKKMARDITYNDILMTMDFDTGKMSETKPLWIKKIQTASKYQLCTFKSGRTIRFIGPDDGNCHRMYCVETGSFEYAPQMIGKHVLLDTGESDILISCEWVEEPVEYMNIVGSYHMSIYTDGILTSCRQNNIYPIENCKFVKDDRQIRTIEDYSPIITEELFDGLRLAEQTTDIDKINAYVENMINGMKPKN